MSPHRPLEIASATPIAMVGLAAIASWAALSGDPGTLLALEHRTQPTDAAARRRFARYWLAIRPGGAFVTRQLLKAVARRAERGAAATRSTTHLSN